MTKLRSIRSVALAGVLIASLVGIAQPVSAATGPPGTIALRLTAPAGVPASVVVKRLVDGSPGRITLTKSPGDSTVVRSASVSAGVYDLHVPSVVVDGTKYVASIPEVPVVVLPGRTSHAAISLRKAAGPSALVVSSLTDTSSALSWTADLRTPTVIVRRAAGAVAPTRPTSGVGVEVKGATATDSGLTPGTQYSYAVFARPARPNLRLLPDLRDPLTLTLSSAPANGSGGAAFVAVPTTAFLTAAQIASATGTGDGLTLVLSPGTATPQLGAAVVLPITDALPGGYLGIVAAIGTDGRTLTLTPGGLDAAFDYFNLPATSFTSDAALLPAPPATAAAKAKQNAKVAAPAAEDARAAAAAAADAGSSASGQFSAKANAKLAPQAAEKESPVACDASATAGQVTLDRTLAVGGHFGTSLKKKGFLGKDIPVGATIDAGITLTVKAEAKIKNDAKLTCKLELPKLFVTVVKTPVPISVLAEPDATFTLAGKANVEGIGAEATASVGMTGTISLPSTVDLKGNHSLDAKPLTPKIVTNASASLDIGGAVTLGPGAGTKKAGVIGGLQGSWSPLAAELTPHFVAASPYFNLCADLDLRTKIGLAAYAGAWFSNWSASKSYTLDALNKSFDYPGSPYTLPKGCGQQQQGTPDSLLGDGVTKQSDTTTGSATQWAHLSGFAPGKDTWVLSTGDTANAVGVPSTLASTNLGEPGDADLSALAGYPTYDAATYEAQIVPTGKQLHVRYVFATEEFPKYVGSTFNDVMAVYVNGKNCAFVPGTTTPVSVNTVNTTTNSAYFVDNQQGAAGYGTTMNGLTVPLTCTVPVTPGTAVDVRIAVADGSDHVLDSAVALVDGGIWSD